MIFSSKHSVGIDVADHSLEAVELVFDKKIPEVVSLARLKLRAGIIERGRVKDAEQFRLAIKELLASAKPNPIKPENVSVSLPDSLIYLHYFQTAARGSTALDEAVNVEIARSIPMVREDLVYTYREIGRQNNLSQILIAAVDRIAVTEWQETWLKCGFSINFFDLEQ